MVFVDGKICDECGTCISVCPMDAIILDDCVIVNSGKCISCGKCVKVCPVGAMGEDGQKQSAGTGQ